MVLETLMGQHWAVHDLLVCPLGLEFPQGLKPGHKSTVQPRLALGLHGAWAREGSGRSAFGPKAGWLPRACVQTRPGTPAARAPAQGDPFQPMQGLQVVSPALPSTPPLHPSSLIKEQVGLPFTPTLLAGREAATLIRASPELLSQESVLALGPSLSAPSSAP